MSDPDQACIRLRVHSSGFSGHFKLIPYLDFDVHNKDSNYGDQFWERKEEFQFDSISMVSATTKKTRFTVSSWMRNHLSLNDKSVPASDATSSPMQVFEEFSLDVKDGDTIVLDKFIVNLSSLYVRPEQQTQVGKEKIVAAAQLGYDGQKRQHVLAWKHIWDRGDIEIDGDVPAQQGIRFNIFHLWQTYTGEDPRLNIGPKGFTGEKYGGSTYWDTEAYCIPFYLGTAEPNVARNLLTYRFLHLQKAIENAEKLGFSKGAALYPMVTINGEECHNEWEITFEEIHRNGAIAYAIYDYIRYTGDESYMLDGGLEVLIGIARFWAQRVNFSKDKNAFVMLGVTGPNEYENNVNNNWYTNYIARWCLRYAREQIIFTKKENEEKWREIERKTNLSENETEQWNDIADKMYFPWDENRQVFLQQDGFLDKEIKPAVDIPADQRPIHQHWSWDRILRSCFIKQADVLQGMYFFEDQFTMEVIGRHFDFYEPMTVHESSLSPCVHAILAAHLGKLEKAEEMYHRTARLDLDDYNNDTEDGLHITSMAGTWMAVVKGFGGLSVREGQLHFSPVLPLGWKGIKFKMQFRKRILDITLAPHQTTVVRLQGDPIEIFVQGQSRQL